MIRKRFFVVYLAILLCLSSAFAQAHTYKITVIVDTDMALDDMRALAMLLNSSMIDIPLIVTSDGSTSPQAGCRNLGTLLQCWNTDRDPDSARFVFDSGLKIYSMGLPEKKLLHFGQDLYKEIEGMDTAVTTRKSCAQ